MDYTDQRNYTTKLGFMDQGIDGINMVCIIQIYDMPQSGYCYLLWL